MRRVRPGTLGAEWQCGSHCQVASSVPQRYAQGRVAVRRVRSGPSGSATGAPGYARSRVAVRITLPSGVERTAAVRSGSSGSATGTLGCAQARVAVRITLPLAGERAGVERSVPSGSATGTLGAEWQCDWYARGRVVVWTRAVCGPAGTAPTWGRLPRRVSASDETVFYGPRQPLG